MPRLSRTMSEPAPTWTTYQPPRDPAPRARTIGRAALRPRLCLGTRSYDVSASPRNIFIPKMFGSSSQMFGCYVKFVCCFFVKLGLFFQKL